jgi:hypothetical protein
MENQRDRKQLRSLSLILNRQLLKSLLLLWIQRFLQLNYLSIVAVTHPILNYLIRFSQGIRLIELNCQTKSSLTK